MKTIERKTRVDTRGVEVFDYTVEMSSHLFDILINKLYNDKISAVMREIGCNAYDAHIENGNADEPFEVHLPNSFCPYFYIRDFGTGMTPEEIVSLYTRLGASDKRDSNDFTGCMGIGSKSPFCYQNNFSIESFLDGKRYIYSAFIGEDGKPKVAVMPGNGSATIEPNGVKVQMAVPSIDFGNFNNKAAEVFSYFKTIPKIVGQSITIEQPKYRVEGSGWKLRACSPYYNKNSKAIMGNVAYPISFNDDQLSEKQRILMMCPIDIWFDIGELQVAANREGLQYDKRTIRKLLERFDDIIEDVVDKLCDSIRSAKTLWDARVSYIEVRNDYQNHLTKLLERKNIQWNGIELFTSFMNEIDVPEFEHAESFCRVFSKIYGHINSHKMATCMVPSNMVKLVVDDLDRGAMTRCKHYISITPNINFVYLFKFGSPQDRQNVVNTLGITDDHFIPASSLQKPPKAQRASRQAVEESTNVLLYNDSRHTSCYSYWKNIEKDLADGGLYVEVNRFKVKFNGTLENPYRIANIVVCLKSLGFDTVVYGLKTAVISQALRKGKWECFFEYAKRIAEEKEKELNAAQRIADDKEFSKLANCSRIDLEDWEAIEKYSQSYNGIDKFVKQAKELNSGVDIDICKTLKNLYHTLGLVFPTKKPKFNVVEIEDKLYSKYRLLSLFTGYDLKNYYKDIGLYINAVEGVL